MSPPSSQDRYITTCPVGCGADLVVTDIVMPEGRLLRCRACGQLISQLSESAYCASMRAIDVPDYHLPDEEASDRRMENATRRLTRVCELLSKPASEVRLLDVSCARGDFVAAAQTLGFDAEGVEPAPHSVEAGRATGRKLHTGRLEEQGFPDASFDAAALFEVVEQLREPIVKLHEIRRILKPGGVLLLSTGNCASWTARVLKQDWSYFQTSTHAGHVSFFNPRSLALAGQRAGFEVAGLYTARVRLVIKGKVSGPIYAAGKLAAELLNYPARLLGRGHDMIAYLRRVG